MDMPRRLGAAFFGTFWLTSLVVAVRYSRRVFRGSASDFSASLCLWADGADHGLCGRPRFRRPFQFRRHRRALGRRWVQGDRHPPLQAGAGARCDRGCGGTLPDRFRESGLGSRRVCLEWIGDLSPGKYDLLVFLIRIHCDLLLPLRDCRFHLERSGGRVCWHPDRPLPTLIHLFLIPVTNPRSIRREAPGPRFSPAGPISPSCGCFGWHLSSAQRLPA